MELIIHRGARQIGGNCLEIRYQDATILVDVGLPLDSSADEPLETYQPNPLFHDIRHGGKRIDGVLLSHAHMDHYGLAGLLPEGIPIYCGQATADLIGITASISRDKRTPPSFHTFQTGKVFRIGPFSIQPYLVDHSAFDAHAFLISAGDKHLFYTGDFRSHGRKAGTIERLMKNPPKVDVMVIEGTMLGPRSQEAHLTEKQLEEEFLRVINETAGIVLVTAAGQNIDRLVTIYKAAKRARRRFVIDFYTAEILEKLGKYARVPQPSWPGVRVCYPQRIAGWFESIGLTDVLKRQRKYGINWRAIRESEDRTVMLIRPKYLTDIQNHLTLAGATWIYSMWPGYLERDNTFNDLRAYLKERSVRVEILHSGGHATLESLIECVTAVKPKSVIPVHSRHPELFKSHLANIRIVNDGDLIPL